MTINGGDILNRLADRYGVDAAFEALDASKEQFALHFAALGKTFEEVMSTPFEDITAEGEEK